MFREISPNFNKRMWKKAAKAPVCATQTNINQPDYVKYAISIHLREERREKREMKNVASNYIISFSRPVK